MTGIGEINQYLIEMAQGEAFEHKQVSHGLSSHVAPENRAHMQIDQNWNSRQTSTGAKPPTTMTPRSRRKSSTPVPSTNND